MSKRKMPKSVKKHIRREKSRIRREVLDLKKQEELINKLYNNEHTANTQSSDKAGD